MTLKFNFKVKLKVIIIWPPFIPATCVKINFATFIILIVYVILQTLRRTCLK